MTTQKERCSIYCNSNQEWLIQVGYEVHGTRYTTQRGARIAATKLNLSYTKDKKV